VNLFKKFGFKLMGEKEKTASLGLRCSDKKEAAKFVTNS
jgi:hypothetical protein